MRYCVPRPWRGEKLQACAGKTSCTHGQRCGACHCRFATCCIFWMLVRCRVQAWESCCCWVSRPINSHRFDLLQRTAPSTATGMGMGTAIATRLRQTPCMTSMLATTTANSLKAARTVLESECVLPTPTLRCCDANEASRAQTICGARMLTVVSVRARRPQAQFSLLLCGAS